MIAAELSAGTNVALLTAAIGAAATVSVAAITFTLSRLAESAARRRDGYAAATRELVAWVEMPYRIRRRTSDEPEVLADLAARLHDGQEALAYRSSWIRSDSRWLAEIFDDVRGHIRCEHGPACGEAWRSPPVTNPADMVLNGWGPTGLDAHVARFEQAATHRFGWRRACAAVGMHPRT